MKNKIIYVIMILIIIAGAIVIGTIGLNVDLQYSKSVQIDVYLGKTFENEDIKQIAKEVFGEGKIIVQKVEYYEDMASITIEEKNAENIDEKIKELNTKINEKYELENKVEDSIQVLYIPKVRLSSILKPYLVPMLISSIVVLVYVAIRYRKLGVLRTILTYALSIVGFEALYLSIIAITRFPVNNYVIPVGLLIYVLVITVLTIIKENAYTKYKETEK